jgi:uncharacterized lipoprotein YddW (UPF0748 family)
VRAHLTGRRSAIVRALAVLAIVVFTAAGAVAPGDPAGTLDTNRSAETHAARSGMLDRTCAGRVMQAVRELRGLWITTVNNLDWPSRPGLDAEAVKAEYRGWLDLAQRLNFNAVFVHIRPSGDAFWQPRRAQPRLGSARLHGRRDTRPQP